MLNIDIEVGTPVRHTDYPDSEYRVSLLHKEGADVKTLQIGKRIASEWGEPRWLFCAEGSPDNLRAQGYRFGADEFEHTWAQALGQSGEGPATPEEGVEEHSLNKSVMLQEIAALKTHNDNLKRHVSTLEQQVSGARTELSNLKTNLVGWFSDQVDDGSMDRESANQAIKDLGLTDDWLLNGTYRVTVSTPNGGAVITTRDDVEAMSSDEACDAVRSMMEDSCGYIRKIRWVLDFEGDEVEFMENLDSNLDEQQLPSELVRDFIAGLSITAEEVAK